MRAKFIYRWVTLILFLTEVFIAVLVPNSSFIRHSFGDYLVVILVYSFVKSFIDIRAEKLAVGVLTFSFVIEFAQYFHVIDLLGVNNKIVRIVLGTSFSMSDLVCYTLGCLTVYVIDVFWRRHARY